MTPFRCFIGYDQREAVALYVLMHSILTRASLPVMFIPIVKSQLWEVYTRERGPLESTDFSLTRFLVPWMSNYDGYSLYLDSDMLCLADIHHLIKKILGYHVEKAVWVCKHKYRPCSLTKMEGQTQTDYPKKNWSSLMVFNNARCRALTPEYVNRATGLDLHRFAWLKDDHEIGALPNEWNWLSGEYQPNPMAKIIHYTLGGPWWKDYQFCDHADLWFKEYETMCPSFNHRKPMIQVVK